ncbi:hypothetical protein WJX84_009395 [Apatococcus fuscideae]|uniref:Uncharacterized protein n=1 Tax=Apatococcus fuscideae TaxID=2026836 RepID=A0AAW1SQJ3_9CHLO
MLIFLSRLGADVVIWTVAVTVAGVCTVGLWQLRSGQLAWEACADFVSWVVDSSSFALQQVLQMMPGWTRLTHLKTTKCAHLGRLSGQKTIKMLPLACLGDSGTGKTFLLQWLTQGRPPQQPRPTCAADLLIKPYEDANCLAQLWDVGGRLQASFLKPPFFQLAAGVVLLYDARSPRALESLDFWYQFLVQKCGCSKESRRQLPPIVVLGNLKADAPAARLLEVKTEVAAWCEAHGDLPHKLIPLPGTLVGIEWAIRLLLTQVLIAGDFGRECPVMPSSPVSSPRFAAQKASHNTDRSVHWSGLPLRPSSQQKQQEPPR